VIRRHGVWIPLLTALAVFLAAGCGGGGSPGTRNGAGEDGTDIVHVESENAGDLIPREVLFGNPERVNPQVSPDGRLLAYIAPVDSVLNLWLMEIDGSGPRQLTFDEGRGIRDYFWAYDGVHILYMQDRAGEENTHVYRLNIETGEITDLTPFDDVKAYVSAVDEDHPQTILVEMNRNDPMFFDVYSCDLETGELTIIQENPGMSDDGEMVLGYLADRDLQVRGMVVINPDDGTVRFLVRKTPGSEWEELFSFSPLDTVMPIRFSEDGKGLYYQSNVGSNTVGLMYINLETGEITEIARDSIADVSGVIFNPVSGKPRAVVFYYLRRNVLVLDPDVEDDYEFLETFHPGDFSVVSHDLADSTWVVAYYTPRNPATYYLYHRSAGEMTFLFDAVPSLADYSLAEVEPVVIKAADGWPLPSYLTLPSRGEKPYPMVLFVHGGPWSRDYYGYNPFVQLLADRGFAVLQVNFRGSMGFGKEHLNAGNKEWGGLMQDDLTDAVKWAIREGIADPDRIVIMGGSYGGYATLAGVTFTPDLYCAGVDFFGPSDLVTFRKSVPPYWRPLDALMDVRIGSLEEDSLMLEERSPLNHVENIKVPMLIVQGANDPRVVQAESDQIVEALRENGNEVCYLVYLDEGHGFALEANRLEFAGRVEEFLYNHVPGVECRKYEAVPNSTVRVQ